MYLVRLKAPKTKHLWKTGGDMKEGDTVCHQYSTGGLNKSNYEVVKESTLPTCVMCDRKDHAFKGLKWNS